MAEKLGRKEEQVVARLAELGVEPGKKKKARATAGYNIHKSGAVSMTGARSLKDDINAGTSPFGASTKPKKDSKTAFEKRHGAHIHRPFGKE